MDAETIKYNDEQRNVIDLLKRFIMRGEDKFFVLNGYSGSGKTTVIKAIVEFCKEEKIPITLLASTGRAAKILSKKTGFRASTVHKLIYVIELSELDNTAKSKKVQFRLNANNSPENTIYVIDESSMLSDKQLTQIFTLFGTGSLLDDLINYSGNRKIVFVGDNAQLTPINSHFCPALNLNYLLMKYKAKGTAAMLKTIVRYNSNEVISTNAQLLVNNIRSDNDNIPLKIRASGYNNIDVFSLDTSMIEDYAKSLKDSSIDECIFITFSNKLASIVNREVRALLFGNNIEYLLPGEILMVQQNNYLHDVANGEHIKIISTTGEVHKRAGLDFIPVEGEVNEPDGKRRFNCLLLKEYLDLKGSRLDNESEYNLTVDFMIRMRKKGVDPKKTPGLFKDMLLTDKYLNALRARYGYAITCHKAQGGEWPDVYVIFEKGLWHPNNKRLKHRWAYTAITRTQTNLRLLDNLAIV